MTKAIAIDKTTRCLMRQAKTPLRTRLVDGMKLAIILFPTSQSGLVGTSVRSVARDVREWEAVWVLRSPCERTTCIFEIRPPGPGHSAGAQKRQSFSHCPTT